MEEMVHYYRNRGSSVGIVSDYELDEQAIGVRSPAQAKGFFFSNFYVQTNSEAHPASCPMDPFPGDKARPGRDTDHSPLPNSKVENE
jgi:hypothetical protein